MPAEFVHDVSNASEAYKLTMAYDGSGRRISKTFLRKAAADGDWYVNNVTHYTGIGSEIRESHVNGQDETKIVVNMPQGLGRYGIEEVCFASEGTQSPSVILNGTSREGSSNCSYNSYKNIADEFYLKNHLGSTMMVTQVNSSNENEPAKIAAAYDYRAFGEQIDLTNAVDKVTENFTGKEKDDETDLNYFGARYLDPMLGMWTSVDAKRQFASPYLYAGNGVNPVNVIDPDGNAAYVHIKGNNVTATVPVTFQGDAASATNIQSYKDAVYKNLNGQYGHYNLTVNIVDYNPELHAAKMNNVINLNSSANYDICQDAHSCVTRNFNEAFVYQAAGEHTWVHEFAHLLGLDDKYHHEYMNYTNYGEAYDGYDNANLMVKGLFLKESQIEEMWSPGSIHPQGGYQYNEIERE